MLYLSIPSSSLNFRLKTAKPFSAFIHFKCLQVLFVLDFGEMEINVTRFQLPGAPSITGAADKSRSIHRGVQGSQHSSGLPRRGNRGSEGLTYPRCIWRKWWKKSFNLVPYWPQTFASLSTRNTERKGWVWGPNTEVELRLRGTVPGSEQQGRGKGGGKDLAEKVFIDLLTSPLTQGNSVRICQVDKLKKGIPSQRNTHDGGEPGWVWIFLNGHWREPKGRMSWLSQYLPRPQGNSGRKVQTRLQSLS